MVRQSKRDARLKGMIPNPLYIGEPNKQLRFNCIRMRFVIVSRLLKRGSQELMKIPVSQRHGLFLRLNKWPTISWVDSRPNEFSHVKRFVPHFLNQRVICRIMDYMRMDVLPNPSLR